MDKSGSDLELPGFRFHPTEEELLDFYLRRTINGKRLNFEIIGTLNLYRHDPWELPGLAKIGEREWYFFVPRDRKQANGGRPNRTTERGFWKATGSDRPVRSVSDPKRLIGLKKTLVYYQGRAPRGTKTDWVMNEYRLPEEGSPSLACAPPPKGPDLATSLPSSMEKFDTKDIVICKIYKKATTMKELEQRAAIEEANTRASHCLTSIIDDIEREDFQFWTNPTINDFTDMNMTTNTDTQTEIESSSSVLNESIDLQELEVQKYNAEWPQGTFVNQLRSSWVDQWSPYANVLNF